MSTLKMKRLKDASVQFISLVDHGANRDPFRIIKSHPEDAKMGIDLGRLFRKAAPRSPELAFVAVSKADAVPALLDALKAAGITTLTTQTDSKDGVVLSNPNFDLEELSKADELVTLTVDADTVIGVTTGDDTATEVIKKYFQSYSDSTNFTEVAKSSSTLPMLAMSADALMNTMWNILDKAENTADAETLVTEALEEFEQAALSVIRSVPITAFKLESVWTKSDAPKGIAALVAPVTTTESTDTVVADKKADEPEGQVAQTEVAPPAAAVENKPVDTTPEVVVKQDNSEILAALSSMTTMVKGLSDRMSNTEKAIRKMDSDINGKITVDTAEETISKSDDDVDDEGFVNFDTAYGDPFAKK